VNRPLVGADDAAEAALLLPGSTSGSSGSTWNLPSLRQQQQQQQQQWQQARV
jgi:hypothetical protein